MHDKAVSPIIATILLIAITVTLAATFYTEVSPYFSQNQYFTPQAQIQVIAGNQTHAYAYYIYVSYFPGSLALHDVDMILISNGTQMIINLGAAYPQDNLSTTGLGVNVTLYTDGPYFNSGSYVFLKMSSPLSYISFVDMKTGSTIVSLSSNI